jgi:hypothetical protein
MASASRRRRTHPSCPFQYEATINAVHPNCGKCSTRGVIECQSTRGAWASTRGCGARHAMRTRVPSSAGRRGGGTAPRARYSELWGNGAVSGERGGESTRGDEDAGAHARHMRRRTSSRQLTLPPRSISRLSSASLPSYAASHTALPIESLIASAALYKPSPARTPAHSGGAHAWLRGDAREAAARTPSWCACSSPSELGWRRQTWYTTPYHPIPPHTTHTTPYHPIPPATPGSRGAERVRSRPSGSTRALGNPPLALTTAIWGSPSETA